MDMMLLMFVVISLCDIIITYYITSKLVKRLVTIDIKNILIAIVYGVVFGIFAHLTDRSALYQVLGIVAQFIIILLIVKKSFASSLIAFGLYYSVLILFHSPFLVATLVFDLDETIVFTIGMQFITIIFAMIIYKAIPLNKIFTFIEKHVVLKFVILVLTFIGFLLALYHNINAGGSFSFMLIGIGVIVGTFVALCTLGREIYQLTYTTPLKEHDLKISFYGRLIKAYKEENHSKIEEIKALGKKNNFDMNFNFQLGKAKENILAFIEHKCTNSGRKVEIINDIVYFKDHHTIGIDIIIKLLEILLDNALESGTNKPIIIRIRVDLGNVRMEISNEYQMIAPDSINRMFDKGSTTKGAGRGFGLDNLYRTVKQFDGKIITNHDFNEIGNADYLTFFIEI